MKSALLRHLHARSLLVFSTYLALACLVTYPAVLRLSTELIGEPPESDAAEMMWLVWWLKRALFEGHWRLTEIPLLFYPEGLSYPLLATQIGVQILSLPIALLTSPLVAYNLSMLLSLALAGLTAYWLGLALTNKRLAAFVGGMVWAFFPNKMGHALGGHIFQVAVFLYPLYVLCLWRMLQQPSAARGILAGLVGAVAATIHSVHVVYFLVPVTLLLVSTSWFGKHRGYWTRARLAAYSAAGLIGLGVLVPLYWPVLQQDHQGSLQLMAVSGVVGFAADLASYFVPAPENPVLALMPDIRDFSRSINATYNESITYLGVVPALLAGLGLWHTWRASRKWLLLGSIAGLLSLGPLLKVGGQLVEVQVENFRGGIVLPYWLLMKLPFLQWSRTPARLTWTVSFALTVLVAYGAARLFANIRSSMLSRSLGVLLSVLILVEYLVVWPFPTTSVASAEVYEVIRDDPAVVLHVPASSNLVTLQALLGQTVHGQPIIGGRLPGYLLGGHLLRDGQRMNTLRSFLNQLLLQPDMPDMLPQSSVTERLKVLRSYDVGWVAYHDVGDDSEGSGRLAIESFLGSPAVEGSGQSLYPLPPGSKLSEALIYALGDGWYPVETWGAAQTRWFYGNGVVYVYSPFNELASLQLTLIPELLLHVIAVKVNGSVVTEIAVGDWLPFSTEPFSLRAGLNVIELVDVHGARTYVGDLRCAAGTPLSGVFTTKLACDSGRSIARPISAGVQGFQLLPATAAAPPQALFGDGLTLLQSHWQPSVIPGETLRLTLYWRADTHIDTEWTAFTHVLSPDGSLLAGLDQQPMGGHVPTTTWSPGQLVAYSVSIPIPATADAGEYRIGVGWYQWPSLKRFLAQSDSLRVSDRVVTLGTVLVQQSADAVSSP